LTHYIQNTITIVIETIYYGVNAMFNIGDLVRFANNYGVVVFRNEKTGDVGINLSNGRAFATKQERFLTRA